MPEEQQQPSPAEFNRRVIAEFRQNAGRVGGPFDGAPLVLVTSTGTRTGRRHTTPTMYLRDNGRIVVFASNAGFDHNPAWFHNISADARVTVEIAADSATEAEADQPDTTRDGVTNLDATRDGVTTLDAIATVLHGAERDRLYARQARLVPAFADYEAKTERIIPVVALRPLRPAGDGARAYALSEELVHIHDGMRRELADIRAQLGTAAGTATAQAGAHTGGGAEVDTGAHSEVDTEASGKATAHPRAYTLAHTGADTETGGTATPHTEVGAELRSRCLAFCAGLHEHHTKEDGSAFPPLEERFPELAPALARLRAEHTAVARINADLTALLAEDSCTDPATLRARFDELSGELEDHFDYEEAQLATSLDTLFPR
ncbi:deazaflavin-dependent oxidoreductase (nitroreductase family) [Murinocardiopsis flavida]|uniref:Deazaflavin-dependent oxidoreductase (Nitroreductase family) n=1 Tax=Murinocardiopsis flavida TaxID=645275 RepID=A0A2P8DU66_9ACTN|nr:nitroreductase/quinone reductase family protein [Murinocardiopsis flavida]PSL00761.1 deazaflavin-dependent oxidoreductase (nitroreductase family) [Murinocardiopsis flavida]